MALNREFWMRKIGEAQEAPLYWHTDGDNTERTAASPFSPLPGGSERSCRRNDDRGEKKGKDFS
jgi:hypothetical protein